jgi:hypothetical protein
MTRAAGGTQQASHPHDIQQRDTDQRQFQQHEPERACGRYQFRAG